MASFGEQQLAMCSPSRNTASEEPRQRRAEEAEEGTGVRDGGASRPPWSSW